MKYFFPGLCFLFVTSLASAQTTINIPGMPPVRQARPFHPPDVKEDILPNGLRIWYSKSNDLPTVEMTLVIHAGSYSDDSAKNGCAFLTSEILVGGTRKNSADALAARLAEAGSSITAVTQYDNTQLYTVSLTRSLPQTLDVLSEIAMAPAFDTTAFKLKKEAALAKLYSNLGNHSMLVTQTLLARMYGYSAAYAYTPAGRFRDVFSLTIDDCKAFYSKWYSPENATLVISGNVDYAGIKPLLLDRFGSWKRTPVTPKPAAVFAGNEPSILIIDDPDLKSALLRIGYQCTSRKTADFEQLLLTNELFGGSRSSRLARAFFGERAMSPNFTSGLSFHKNNGYCIISGSLPPKYADSALKIIDRVIRFMTDSLVTEEELFEAKKAYTDGFDREFSTNKLTLTRVQELAVYGLDRDNYDQYIQRFQRITREDVRKTANILFGTPRVIIVGGDAEVLEPLLKSAFTIPVNVVTRGELMMGEEPPGFREWESRTITQ